MFLLVASLLATGRGQDCFPDAIPQNQRHNLQIGGKEIALGVEDYGWVSAKLVEEVFLILVTERLGINADLYETSYDTEGFLFRMMGCRNPSLWWSTYTSTAVYQPYCDIDDADTHVALEAWAPNVPWSIPWMKSTYPQYAPIDLGSIGYPGQEGIYVPRNVFATAIEAEGLGLGYYTSYNSSWHEPSKYFRNLTEVPTSLLSPCKAWQTHNSSLLKTYPLHTGDSDGIVQELGGFVSQRCWFGHWWLSPSCRKNISLCIPFITAQTWFIASTMTLAAYYNMPIAIAEGLFDNSNANYAEVGQMGGILLYSWFPDPTFINLDPLLVTFPVQDRTAWAAGDLRTGSAAQVLRKYASVSLPTAAPAAYNLLDGMSVTPQQITDLMKQLLASADPSDVKATACQWLLDNPAVWTPWIPKPTNCAPGEGLVDNNLDFVNASSQAAACSRCSPGRYSLRVSDGRICKACAGGRFSNAYGSTECILCSRGFYAASHPDADWGASGSTSCIHCPLGTFQNSTGAESCRSCDSVIPRSKTLFGGAVEASDCNCPEGTLLLQQPDGSQTCESCSIGLLCPGATPPLQAVGFYARSAQLTEDGALLSPPAMVRCRSSERCPGGLPLGTCPRNLERLACDVCKGNFRFFRGECVPCSSAAGLPIAVAVGVMACVTFVLSWMGTGPSETTFNVDRETLAASLEFCLKALQILAAFSQLDFVWVEPWLTLRVTFSAVTGFFSPSCLLGRNSPVISYTLALLILPACGIMVLIELFLLRLCGREVGWRHVVNTLGSAVLSANLAMALIALQPWGCQMNPDRSSTVTFIRSVTCWTSGEHAGLLGMSVAGLLFYITLPAALVGWACRMYPLMVVQPGGVKFVQHFYFLFGSLKPDHYIFAILLLGSNVALVLVPIVLQPFPGLAPICMLGVLSLVSLEAHRRAPWRAPFVNHLFVFGILLTQGVMLALTTGAQEALSSHHVQIFTVSIVCLGAAVLLVKFSLMILKVVKREKPFKVFLCHHKRDAGTLARWLKMELQDRVQGDIFLDSDNLESLDGLFSIVASETQNLVILLTKETLSRLWCAGELACATEHKVNIIPVVCDDFGPVTDDFIDETDVRWSDREKSSLIRANLSTNHIKDGYKYLRTLQPVRLSLHPDDISNAVDQIVSRCTGIKRVLRHNFNVLQGAGQTDRQILLIGDTRDVDQAKAIRLILQRRLQKELQVTVQTFESPELEIPRNTMVFIFVLTKKVIRDPLFLKMLLFCDSMHSAWLPVIADADFSVPHDDDRPDGYRDFMAGKFVEASVLGVPLRNAAFALRKLFKILALRLSPHTSEKTIEAEVEQIAGRAKLILSSAARSQQVLRPEYEVDNCSSMGSSCNGDQEEECEMVRTVTLRSPSSLGTKSAGGEEVLKWV